MVRFSKGVVDRNGNLVETDIREIPQRAMLQCPHTIMVADHYRKDNSCRCDDPQHTEMAEWGYTWRKDRWM